MDMFHINDVKEDVFYIYPLAQFVHGYFDHRKISFPPLVQSLS